MLILAALAMMILIALSNYLVQFPINDWLHWGAFLMPFTFLVSEMVNKTYGPTLARRVVWFGFLTASVCSVLLFPWRIGFASCTAFLISQLLDIHLFYRLRAATWWKAPFFASLLATWIDTWIFFPIAFWGEPLPWVTLGLGDFFIKFGVDMVCLLPFRMFISANRTPLKT